MRRGLFDGRMIRLDGGIVVYPKWFFLWLNNAQRILDRRAREVGGIAVKIIERDRATGLFRVLEPVREQLGPIIDLPKFRLHDLKASDPSFFSGKARVSGRRGLGDLLELGIGRESEYVED